MDLAQQQPIEDDHQTQATSPKDRGRDPAATTSAPPTATESRKVSTVLWIILGVSVAFLALVQFLVDRLEVPTIPAASLVAEAPVLTTYSPIGSTTPAGLSLGWQEVSGATTYNLRIHAPDGSPVVDPLPVWGTSWTPADQVMPGLASGGYTWSVEALDSAGTVLAKSLAATFTIQH